MSHITFAVLWADIDNDILLTVPNSFDSPKIDRITLIMKLILRSVAFLGLLIAITAAQYIVVEEYDYFGELTDTTPSEGTTDPAETTTMVETTTAINDDDKSFNGISFLYGAMAGVGGALIIAVAVIIIKVNRGPKAMRSFELSTYADNDV
jgi:hypothetical protein